jgi:hypothetical protein
MATTLAKIRAQRESDRESREDSLTESAPSPATRHGICRLTLRIGGMDYTLRPMPAPPGFTAVWALRKRDPHGPTVSYAVAAHIGDPNPGCTCPDHEYNKVSCKHIMALRALGLIPAAAAPPPSPSPAANPKPRKPRARKPGSLPEGWQPGGAHPSFAAGMREAAGAHVARLSKSHPDVELEICDSCGCEFDPMLSGNHSLCPACDKGGD